MHPPNERQVPHPPLRAPSPLEEGRAARAHSSPFAKDLAAQDCRGKRPMIPEAARPRFQMGPGLHEGERPACAGGVRVAGRPSSCPSRRSGLTLRSPGNRKGCQDSPRHANAKLSCTGSLLLGARGLRGGGSGSLCAFQCAQSDVRQRDAGKAPSKHARARIRLPKSPRPIPIARAY